ncbi:MAG: ral secretion pathway protein [Verrucomicrobiota bacterium]
MLSLWALFLLSAMVISWALEIDSRLTLSGRANRILEAEALACSGAEVAMYPRIKLDSSALEGGFGRDQRYEARITGEAGRLNINWVAAHELASPGSLQLEVLRKYLEIRGVDLNERDQMIDTLLDWVGPNTGLHRLNAPPETENYHPSHTLLKQVDELKKIKGWEEFTSAKDWDADLTLDSKGDIDIKWASQDILMALPGASEDRVDQFLTLRSGSDAINGTEDDPPIAEALVALGIAPQQLQGLIALVPDQVMRVVSVGKSGDVIRTVRAVFVKGSNQLKSWKEF